MSSAVSLISCEGSSDKSAVQNKFVRAGQFLQRGVERPLRQPRLQRQAQLFAPHALKVRVFRVIGCDPGNRSGCEHAPLLARKSHPRVRRFEDNEIEGRRELICSCGGKSAVAGKDGKIGGERRSGQERGEGRERIEDRERRTLRLPFRGAPLTGRRPQIEEDAPAQRTLRRHVADNVAIHGRRGDRPIEYELNLSLIARRDRSVFERDNPRAHFRRAVVEVNRKPLTDRLLFARQEAHDGVDAVRRRMQAGVEHDIATSDRLLLDARTREVERAAIAGPRGFGSPVLRMQGPNARHQPGWADLDPIAHSRRSGIDRPCRHDANTRQREDPVDRKTEACPLRPIARYAARRFEIGAQCVDALSGRRRDRKHARIRERRPADHRSRLARDLGKPLMRGEIGFRQHNDAAVDAQQVQDRQMLERLRLDSVIGRDR